MLFASSLTRLLVAGTALRAAIVSKGRVKRITSEVGILCRVAAGVLMVASLAACNSNPAALGSNNLELSLDQTGAIAGSQGGNSKSVVKVAANAQSGPALSFRKAAKAPQGFASVCGRHRWACGSRGGKVSDSAKLSLARSVNTQVNRSVRSVADSALYGRQDYWTLPTKGQGDCEDYALMKMKKLLDAGVASRDLLLATVLTGKGEHHVVLVVRAGSGDYFLDNLRGSVRTWDKSGYTIVKMQRPTNKASWGLVLRGPMFADTLRRSKGGVATIL